MKYFIIMTVVLLSITSCLVKKESSKSEKSEIMNENHKIVWVNKYKTPCMGMVPMRCLQIQEGDVIDPKKWNVVFGDIEGFNFEPGILYKLLIEEVSIEPSMVPADGSSIKRKLIKVLETIKSDSLDGKWIALEINGINSVLLELTNPLITIDGNKISGTDGCNNVMGSLIESNQYTFKTSPLMGTKMYCEGKMKVADAFGRQMEKSRYYKIMDNELHLQDQEGLVIMKFKRG